MICIARPHVGGHTLALQHSGQNYFLLISCYAQNVNVFKYKICVQKEVTHNFKNHIFVT